MRSRQQSIIYQLVVNQKPMTAEQLGIQLHVSPRTIKTEMKDIRSELSEVGIQLIAKRNEGYSIKITDETKFMPFFEQLSLRSTIVNNFVANDMACFLYIARKLISSSRYAKLDDMADELFLSRSALRAAMKKTVAFLKSYQLIIESKPVLGIHVYGMEYQMRMAMTELFGIHFHKAILDHAGMDYGKWIACDYEERQKIRHCFLKVLRESPVRITDSETQRLSIYFIIARNRFRCRYFLHLNQEWIREMKETEEYAVAASIYEKLSYQFEDYQMSEEEVAFLSIWLFCIRDTSGFTDLEQRYGSLYRLAKECADQMISLAMEVHDIDFCNKQELHKNLTRALIHILAKKKYGMELQRQFFYAYENPALKSPIATEIAKTMTDVLVQKQQMEITEFTLGRIAIAVYRSVTSAAYDIRRLKLLVVNATGMSDMSLIIGERLMDRYPDLIESFEHPELYEIRGMDESQYDAVLMEVDKSVYNYGLPLVTGRIIPLKGEGSDIFREVLIKAYQVRKNLPQESCLCVYDNFDYTNEKQFFQFISFKHCSVSQNRIHMEQEMTKREAVFSHNYHGLVILLGNFRDTHKEAIEWYQFSKSGKWSDKEANSILYLCLDWNKDSKKLKAIEAALSQIYLEQDVLKQLEERKMEVFEELAEQVVLF